MMTWNLQSNAADVLGLGPRIAARLLRLGIRSAEQLIAASAERLAAKLSDERFSAQTIAAWQRETQLKLAIPQLPEEAARVLAAIGYGSQERLAQTTPTELFAEIETTLRRERHVLWLAEMTPPTVAEVTRWIRFAGQKTERLAS